MAKKMLVIGWDGATFDIIKPMVDKGEMPNFAALMQNGVWGRLESSIPPLTPVAWTSISTGVNPGKHGIFDAMTFSRESKKVKFMNASMRRVMPVWSLLSERQKNVEVINVPITYPPDKVNGAMITGMFTPSGVPDFTEPAELREEIEEKFGKYMIECAQVDDPSTYLKLILEMVEFREKVSLYLMESRPWDFFFTVFVASDRVQHFFWKYLDPSHPDHSRYGGAISKVFIRMDQSLGRILEKVGPDVNVMMVSDHGSGPLNTAFFLNNWLLKNGYLSLKDEMSRVLKANRTSRLRQGAVKLIKNILPQSVIQKIKSGREERHHEEINIFSRLINWETTVAFSEGAANGIYINPDVVMPERYKEVCSGLIEALGKVTDPSGNKVVSRVYHRDEVYSGQETANAPDLVVICNKGFQIIAPNEIFFFKTDFEDDMFVPHRWSGRHEHDGIFLLKGEGVRKNVEISNARLIDVAPTILYAMNEQVPEYMDGIVLKDAYETEYLRRKEVRYSDDKMGQDAAGQELTEEQEKEIAERLKGLGYIE